jgi:uncharacterized protein
LDEHESPPGRQPKQPSNPWLFFALAYGWSWIAWAPPILLGWEWGELRTLISFGLGFGPLIAALFLIYRGVSDEPPSQFWRRVTDPRRIPVVWWLVILGLPFALNLLARLYPSGDTNGDRDPLTLGTVVFAVVVFGFGASFAEELGWRGYALDPLQRRYTALIASLIIGLAWGMWHLPLFLIEGSYQNSIGIGTTLFWFYMLGTVLWSILYTWIYNHTSRSILAMIVLHAFLNIAGETIGPVADQEFVHMALLALLIVVVVMGWGHRSLGPGPDGATV